jgi:ABC-type lipoprotein export system ATPase subunit
MNEQFVVETHDLTKIYGDDAKVRALDGVNLNIHAGEFVALVGPSGSGKSTLLNMIGALDQPTSGEVIVNGTPLAQVRDLDRFRGHTIGFVFQTHNLIPTLTARENVEVPIYESSLKRAERRQRAEALLELVGLHARMDFLPNQLSGGERQRVAIARALILGTRVLIVDEPTASLDRASANRIISILKDTTSDGIAVLVASHDHELVRQSDTLTELI